MANIKLQASRGLKVIPSDTVNIPNVAAISVSGISGTPSGSQLVGVGTLFTKNVSVGDIVYAGTIAAHVVAVVSDTILTTSLSVPVGLSYIVYSQKNNPSNGCVLYCGGGTLSVVTAGGDTIELVGMTAGQCIPINVLRVNSTVEVGTIATDIVALW